MYECRECGNKFKKDWLFKRHITQTHFPYPEYIIKYNYNNIHPTCGCGCGTKTKYSNGLKDFGKYIRGHIARINNNWSKDSPYFKKSVEHSAVTRRKQYKSGERHTWNEGHTKNDGSIYSKSLQSIAKKIKNNKVRSKKISDALTGVPKSKEHVEKIRKLQKKYWADPIHREEQSHRRMIWMKENDYTVTSKLEDAFADILTKLNIEYKRNFYVREIKSFIDFFLPKYNTYIEVDGDFWHCNESIGYIPRYECQYKNLKKDKIKNEWGKHRCFLRFWENDIKNNTAIIIKRLLNEIKI